jgi:2-methylcitrate dehydratase PrpD
MARTDCYRDTELDAEYPLRWPAAASIVLRDGRELSQRVEFATGEPENPVPLAALREKFESLAERKDASDLADRLLDIDQSQDLSAVAEALRSA